MSLNEEMIVNTFYITYVFLMTTATITFIEAMRTKDIKIRNILNLETCISVVAAFFYGKFVKDVEDKQIVSYTCNTPICNLEAMNYLLNHNESSMKIFKCYEGTLMSLFFNKDKEIEKGSLLILPPALNNKKFLN